MCDPEERMFFASLDATPAHRGPRSYDGQPNEKTMRLLWDMRRAEQLLVAAGGRADDPTALPKTTTTGHPSFVNEVRLG